VEKRFRGKNLGDPKILRRAIDFLRRRGYGSGVIVDLLRRPREDDLIEDDFTDTLGPGSAARFIITDDQIIDYNFTESDQGVYSRVSVTGQIDWIEGNDLKVDNYSALRADATDFDLWRQYGYRADSPKTKPYFNDAATQCAPYALMLLTRSRKNAITGSVTVYGNEYYQLGDVVYLNSRDLLYYVTDVKHDFSYDGGYFKTQLSLKMGHPLGEFIPTPLDVIGKNIIRNFSQFNKVTSARTTANPKLGTHLGLVVFPLNGSSDEDDIQKEMLSGSSGEFNLNELKNILTLAKQHIGKDNPNGIPKIEVRGFFSTTTDEDGEIVFDNSDTVLSRMEIVKDWLINPIRGMYSQEEDTFGLMSELYSSELKLNKKNIVAFNEDIDPVNLGDPQEENLDAGRLPKEEVYAVAAGRKDLSNIIEIVLVYVK